MSVTNTVSGTRVDEVAEGIYRISTPFPGVPGGFSFNQYLLADDEPLLFHTGPRTIFPLVLEAIGSVLPPERLRFVGYSHFESDECGAMPSLLDAAPAAVPLCGGVNAMINGDAFDRPPRALADGDTLSLGRHRVRWIDAPHLPHAWECGYLFEETTATLLCGDLFTQGGADNPPLTTSDILGPSEAFRKPMDYFSHARNVRTLLAPLVATRPKTLACMHGSAWQGDGARLLEALADSLDA
ncbi:MAG: MBL fold metallo-hydrolase [Holophagales bacterium]|nr:MBL fold metallo-hydrolase [Holophagales bacterium]